MAYTSAQIVALACQIAKTPGYLSFAGQLFNTILEELYEVNDFAFIKQKTTLALNVAQPAAGFALPSAYERTLEVFYNISGEPIFVTQIPLEQYDGLFTGPVGTSYPEFYAVDVSQTPRTMLFWPVPPLQAGVTIRYLPTVAAIANPESSSVIPWFTGQLYLITRLAAELMMINEDTRRTSFLKECENMMSKFLTMAEDDRENYARTVKLDPRAFPGRGASKVTKQQPF